MASIRLRPPSVSASTRFFTSRALSSTSRAYDEYQHPSHSSSPSSSSSSTPRHNGNTNAKTAEFLYGPQSNWRKPVVPKKPPTAPRKRPKVDKDAYLNLPDLPAPATQQKEGRVSYSLAEGQSNERRAFFVNDVEEELAVGDAAVVEGEEVAGLEVGRVVECRRSGMLTIGLILANIVIAGKSRLLMLRSSGEIWPVSTHDVQFVMPSSLVPLDLAQACWSPSLLAAWSGSEEQAGLSSGSVAVPEEMMEARRRVAMVLRKVQRETEKMTGRLVGGSLSHGTGNAGGAEAVYERFCAENEEERGSVTAVEAAEYLLNPDSSSVSGDTSGSPSPVIVRPNTLPAYAAHQMLMDRPDIFTADQGDMWDTGVFLVRSKAERRTLSAVRGWVESSDPQTRKPLDDFIAKAQNAIKLSHSLREDTSGQPLKAHQHTLPPWTAEDKQIISILLSTLADTRSTQTPPSLSLAYSIARKILYTERKVDRGIVAHLLQDIGMISPWDSLEMSKVTEMESRHYTMSGDTDNRVSGSEDLLKGNELDHLREDYTSHKVYVIDDSTASELDDGISLQRIPESEDVWVHVHIADPTRYIPLDHPLADQASFRGSTIYLPEGNRPLFPLEVVMKELSLGAETNRDEGAQGTLTFSAKIDKSGTVIDQKIKMGWVKKPRVITYAAVDHVLGVPTTHSLKPFGSLPSSTPSKGEQESISRKTDEPISSEEADDLRALSALAQAHRAQRYARAGLEWSLPTASASLLPSASLSSRQPSFNLFDTLTLPSSPQLYSGSIGIDYTVHCPTPVSASASTTLTASTLVAEYMIIANRLAASFCSSRSIPILYRGSSAPRPLSLSNLSSTTSGEDLVESLLAARPKGSGTIDPYLLKRAARNLFLPTGTLTPSPAPHWVMGFTTSDIGYTRATSPLRRYDDMLVHWQIKSHLAREAGEGGATSKALSGEEVEVLGKRADVGSRRAKRAGKTAENYWIAHLLAGQWRAASAPAPGAGGRASEYNGGRGTVDLDQPLKARISGETSAAPAHQAELTNVNIESLGLVDVQMLHPPSPSSGGGGGGGGAGEWEIGQEVLVKLEEVGRWPNPRVTVRLVQ